MRRVTIEWSYPMDIDNILARRKNAGYRNILHYKEVWQ